MNEKRSISTDLVGFADTLEYCANSALDVLKDGLGTLLKEVPEIQAVRWKLYYNDYEDHGPVGTFVEDFGVLFQDIPDEYDRYVALDDIDYMQWLGIKERHGDHVAQAIKAANKILNSISERKMEDAFGRNVIVKVTKDAITVEDSNVY